MGNIVKDNPKQAAKLSPVSGQFKNWQPSNQAKSDGHQTRNARLHLQKLLESKLDEMLENPALRKQDIEAIIPLFNKDSKMMDIYFNRMLRAVTDTKTEPKVVSQIVETMVKLGYGDKMDITTNGKDLPIPILGAINLQDNNSSSKDK